MVLPPIFAQVWHLVCDSLQIFSTVSSLNFARTMQASSLQLSVVGDVHLLCWLWMIFCGFVEAVPDDIQLAVEDEFVWQGADSRVLDSLVVKMRF